MMKKAFNYNSIIDREADILTGMYAGEWGTICDYDGQYYFVALWNDSAHVLAYEPDEISIR